MSGQPQAEQRPEGPGPERALRPRPQIPAGDVESKAELGLGCILRALLRLLITAGFSIPLWLFVLLRQLPFKRYRRPPLDMISLWGRLWAWTLGIRVHLRNEQPAAMGDIIVCNHFGFHEIPVLLSLFPAVFVIKAEARRVFFIGRELARQGHIFVQRDSQGSRHGAARAVRKAVAAGTRVIIFPEGRANSQTARLPFKPFCFHEAAKQGKLLQGCVIDYLPTRDTLLWDIKLPTFPQLVKAFGRRRAHVSVEFFEPELITDPEEAPERYRQLIEGRLRAYDEEA